MIVDGLMNNLEIIPPGMILSEEFMEPLGVTQNDMTRDLNITADKINNIINGKQPIDADLAIRLSKYFRTSTEFWLNLQSDFDLRIIKIERQS